MARSLLLLCCSIFALSAFGQATKLAYAFSYDTSNAEMQVTMTFKGSKTGKTYLRLPQEWAGQEGLMNAVTSMSISGKGAVMSTTGDSTQRLITHKPGQKLVLSYVLKQDWEGGLTYPKNFRAVIRKEFFQFTGYSLFIHPDGDDKDQVELHLDWSKMPENWSIANSFHAKGKTYDGKASLYQLNDAVYTGGDFRSYSTVISGKPVFVSIRGNEWKFADSTLVNSVNRILTIERTFWNDFSEPYYFVSLIPYDGRGSYNGTALHQAFMLAMTTEMEVGNSLYALLTHEYFHRWVGNMIMLKEGPEAENYWFSEGFTEYYTYRLLYKAGILSFDEYIAMTNDIIAAYYLSSVRNEEKAVLGKNYWETQPFQQIPYKKGFTYALLIDQLVKSGSENKYSLDDVLFTLKKEAEGGKVLTDSTFIAVVKQYSGMDISAIHEQYINKGETIPVFPESMGEQVIAFTNQLGVYELGFNFSKSRESMIVTEVKAGSEAEKAGLRDGQVMKGFSVNYNDTSVPAEIIIEENGVQKVITYIPMSMERIDVPQFETFTH